MANPNIVNVTTIYGNTFGMAMTTATANIVSNPSGSGVVYKINSLTAANINTVAGSVSCEFNNGGSNTYIARNIVVPSSATLVVIAKDTSIYLTENTSIQVTSSANTVIHATASWEQIS